MLAIISDLDNCLAPSDEPGRGLLEPVLATIRAASSLTALRQCLATL